MDFKQVIMHFPHDIDLTNDDQVNAVLDEQNLFGTDRTHIKQQLKRKKLKSTGYESEFWSTTDTKARKPVKIIWK